MRVALNATCFGPRPSGAKQRLTGLYGTLATQCSDIQFTVFEASDGADQGLIGRHSNVEYRPTPLPSESSLARASRGLRFWSETFAREQFDLFETFHLPLVRAPNCPTLVTIHDIRSTLDEAPLPMRTVARLVHRHAIRSADRVITVSEDMKRQILALEPQGQVIVVPNGIDPRKFANKHDRSPQDFLLAVGHFEPRKNYGRLLEAMRILVERGRADLTLAIVGRDGGSLAQLTSLRERLNLGDRVMFRTDVDDDELAALYANAALIVFPSLYEGFGIPILEAMAAGRPLLLSDTPVFRELTEGRGAYFNPTDSAAMADAVAALLDNPARQQELVTYGHARVEDFDFERLAQRLAALYHDVLKRPKKAVAPAAN